MNDNKIENLSDEYLESLENYLYIGIYTDNGLELLKECPKLPSKSLINSAKFGLGGEDKVKKMIKTFSSDMSFFSLRMRYIAERNPVLFTIRCPEIVYKSLTAIDPMIASMKIQSLSTFKHISL